MYHKLTHGSLGSQESKTPNSISIGFAIFAWHMIMTNTNRQTETHRKTTLRKDMHVNGHIYALHTMQTNNTTIAKYIGRNLVKY